MRNNQILKRIGLVALLVAMTAFGRAQAADMAAASGTLADIAVMATQAKANLALAAIGGDVNEIADAAKRADAVDAAMDAGQKAYAAKEAATNEDDDAAATEALDAAHQKADNALNGAVPEATPSSAHDVWKESQTNTGGGPSSAYDPPNIYDVPWQSQGLRSLYSSMFSIVYSSNGGSSADVNDYGDRDATPE